MHKSWWQLICEISGLYFRVERLERLMSVQTDEIAVIKREVTDYQAKVLQKVADLETQINSGTGGVDPDLQAALDDLKSTVDGLSLPA